MHLTLARDLAREIGHPALRADPGAYYLGATTPDIRVITRWDRARTHFFDLDEFGEQSGVAAIFEAHPELGAAAGLDESTVAFVSGYITHLEMDEEWITTIYRPCFGERSVLKGTVLANLLDRVLQYELDRRARSDAPAVQEIRDDLLSCAVKDCVAFLDRETLLQWRDVSADVLCRPLDWERFGTIASRHLRAYGVESEADLGHFLRNIPDLLDQSVREVTQERLQTFRERSRERALQATRAYLS